MRTTARITPLIVAATIAAVVAGDALAGIEVGEQGSAPPPPPQLVSRPTVPFLPPVTTGGIEIAVGAGASLTPYLGWRSEAPMILRAQPDRMSNLREANRSIVRAHAFSQNAYREIGKSESLLWYNYGIWQPW
ncbi:MAG: hypothetical protein HY985_18270 [Magnetospirillum sp.]|nr:hypothetical protein [Magnetospirillum sp.]